MKVICILLTGLLLFSALYSPQPIYPVLIDQFGVEATDIALLQTATFLPLALSPIFYGMVIDRLSPLKVLRFALFFLAAGELLFAVSGSFYTLLASRFCQGLFIPAGMTSILSYIAISYGTDRVQKYISYYMASTMAGGVAGRIMVGFFSSMYGWRFSFILLGGSLFVLFLMSFALKDEKPAGERNLHGIRDMIRNSEYIKPVLSVFFAFLVFSSVMNFYSIRLRELSPDLSEFMIGLAYFGSLFGSFTAYMTPAFAKFTGSYKRTILTAFAFQLGALLLFRIPLAWTSFATLFIFCGAFIVIHASCSGLLNKYADISKGAVNGVYFTVYYMGGVIGSFLPGYVYDHMGWNSFLTVLMASSAAGLMISVYSRIEP